MIDDSSGFFLHPVFFFHAFFFLAALQNRIYRIWCAANSIALLCVPRIPQRNRLRQEAVFMLTCAHFVVDHLMTKVRTSTPQWMDGVPAAHLRYAKSV